MFFSCATKKETKRTPTLLGKITWLPQIFCVVDSSPSDGENQCFFILGKWFCYRFAKLHLLILFCEKYFSTGTRFLALACHATKSLSGSCGCQFIPQSHQQCLCNGREVEQRKGHSSPPSAVDELHSPLHHGFAESWCLQIVNIEKFYM